MFDLTEIFLYYYFYCNKKMFILILEIFLIPSRLKVSSALGIRLGKNQCVY